MKLIFHYSVENFTNTYLIGPENGGDAILVDPGVLDVRLLDVIESNSFFIRWVLITRCQPHHIRGLRTLKKIYNAEIYSRQSTVLDFPCQTVTPGTHLRLGSQKVDVICFPELSHDTVVYKIGKWLFCGDVLSAGKAGKTSSTYATSNLAFAMEQRFFNAMEDALIFPGEGPPTLMRGERLFNPLRAIAGAGVPAVEESFESLEEAGL